MKAFFIILIFIVFIILCSCIGVFIGYLMDKKTEMTEYKKNQKRAWPFLALVEGTSEPKDICNYEKKLNWIIEVMKNPQVNVIDGYIKYNEYPPPDLKIEKEEYNYVLLCWIAERNSVTGLPEKWNIVIKKNYS